MVLRHNIIVDGLPGRDVVFCVDGEGLGGPDCGNDIVDVPGIEVECAGEVRD